MEVEQHAPDADADAETKDTAASGSKSVSAAGKRCAAYVCCLLLKGQ